jgi:hypothetical protein
MCTPVGFPHWYGSAIDVNAANVKTGARRNEAVGDEGSLGHERADGRHSAM